MDRATRCISITPIGLSSIDEELRVLWTVVSRLKCVQLLCLFFVWLSIPAYSCFFHSCIFSRPVHESNSHNYNAHYRRNSVRCMAVRCLQHIHITSILYPPIYTNWGVQKKIFARSAREFKICTPHYEIRVGAPAKTSLPTIRIKTSFVRPFYLNLHILS